MKTCPMCGVAYDETNIFCPTDGAALWSSADGSELVNTVIADRYLIVQQLGEGGMGRVYLAKHVRLPQQWAIKVLHPALVRDAGALARFNQEAANAGRIENPHVARVIDFGETPSGLIYLAMEYVEGQPLSSLITREGSLPPQRAAEITRQVADALTAAHELGIVHRDLKPDNIMVGTRRGGGDDVKVVDFGIAKVTQGDTQKVTQTGFVIGTPEYMSPEQIHAATLDGRSDVYSLALVTFNMLTGELPFPGATPQEGMLMRLATPPRTLAQARPDVAWPQPVQAALDRALAREAEERYPTANGFARDLEQAIVQWHSLGATPASGAPAVGMQTPATPAPVASGNVAAIPTSARPRGRALAGIAAVVAVLMIGIALAAYLHGNRRAARDGGTPADSIASAGVTRTDTGATAGAPSVDTLPNTGAPSVEHVSPDRPGKGSLATVDGTSGNAKSEKLASAEDTPAAPPEREPRERQSPHQQSSKPVVTRDAATTTSPTAGASASMSPPTAPRPQPKPVAQPPARTTTEARQTLDRMAQLLQSLSANGAHAVLGMAPTVLPDLHTRADSVEALYYTLQANLIVGDIGAACRVLHDVRDDARNTRFAAPVQVFSDSLPCR